MCDKNITFEKYFKEKYDLTALRPLQPMMEVRTISKVLESIKPRFIFIIPIFCKNTVLHNYRFNRNIY